MTIEEVLLEYKPLVRSKAKSYYNSVLRDRYTLSDLIQECNIALWKAHKTYKNEVGTTFGQYAKKVIDNQLNQIRIKEMAGSNVKATLPAVQFYDKNSNDTWVVDEETPSTNPNPEEALGLKRMRIAVEQLINKQEVDTADQIRLSLDDELKSDIAKKYQVSRQRMTAKINDFIKGAKKQNVFGKVDRIYN